MPVIGYHQKLARVLDRLGGLYLVDDLFARIADGRMQSHVVNNSWAITEVNQFPRAKQLHIVAALGDLADTEAMHDKLLDFADEVDAGLISAYGRRGWAPYVLERGWRLKTKSYLYQREM